MAYDKISKKVKMHRKELYLPLNDICINIAKILFSIN